MKVFSILFSIYMILLSIIPCGDGNYNFVDQLRTYAGYNTHHDHEGHNHLDDIVHSESHCGEEHCSPLCACACCSIVLDNTLFIEFPPLREFSHYSNPFNFPHQLSGIAIHDIWQPPILC